VSGPPRGGPPGGPPSAPTPAPAPAPPADLAELMRLDGKRIAVVGGYGGIGEVATRLLVAHGAEVAIGGRSQEKAEELASELGRDGARAVGARVDLAERESARAFVSGVVELLGGLDALVNLAGIDLEAPAEEFAEADWQRLLEINLSGAFWLSQAAASAMIDGGGGGHIVHFSSTRSVAGGRRGFAGYAASKGGLNMLVKQLATEWARHGITVNAVAPGEIATAMTGQEDEDPTAPGHRRPGVPLGRPGHAAEVAAVVAFLSSADAGYVTGASWTVDGGMLQMGPMAGSHLTTDDWREG
jgi:NAD(P)-dependent dehydrogenase (short-subunit alcohol dehydrogenase family)